MSTSGAAGRGHWVFDNPFCEPLRRTVLAACRDLEVVMVPGGCYGHVDGPRFNTRSEIAALSAAGVTAVSQTAGPEAVLAGEAGVPFVLVGYVTDYANGVSADAAQVTDIAARISQSTEVLAELANATLPMISPDMLEPAGDLYRFDS
ncbi:MAG: phosphorylase family protein [Acidimicrobiales bacterium]